MKANVIEKYCAAKNKLASRFNKGNMKWSCERTGEVGTTAYVLITGLIEVDQHGNVFFHKWKRA